MFGFAIWWLKYKTPRTLQRGAFLVFEFDQLTFASSSLFATF